VLSRDDVMDMGGNFMPGGRERVRDAVKHERTRLWENQPRDEPATARDLGPTGKSTQDSHPRRAQHAKDFRSRAPGQCRFHLPASVGLFPVGNPSGLPGPSGGACLLPAPPPDLLDSRQRLVSQEAGNL
jgi:hypothetical protein